jgi:hypothetical protein
VKGKVVRASGCLDGNVCIEFRPEREIYYKDKCGWVEAEKGRGWCRWTKFSLGYEQICATRM